MFSTVQFLSLHFHLKVPALYCVFQTVYSIYGKLARRESLLEVTKTEAAHYLSLRLSCFQARERASFCQVCVHQVLVNSCPPCLPPNDSH